MEEQGQEQARMISDRDQRSMAALVIGMYIQLPDYSRKNAWSDVKASDDPCLSTSKPSNVVIPAAEGPQAQIRRPHLLRGAAPDLVSGQAGGVLHPKAANDSSTMLDRKGATVIDGNLNEAGTYYSNECPFCLIFMGLDRFVCPFT